MTLGCSKGVRVRTGHALDGTSLRSLLRYTWNRFRDGLVWRG